MPYVPNDDEMIVSLGRLVLGTAVVLLVALAVYVGLLVMGGH